MKSESTALITGASRGIGLALANEIAAHKHNVVLVARNADALEAAAGVIEGKYDVRATTVTCDLAEAGATAQLYESIRDQGLDISILVNNAGFGLGGEFVDTDLDRELQMIDVNVGAVVQLTKLFLPAMVKKRSGHIMNVASTAAFQPGPHMSIYYATKAFVLSFSEAIAEELSRTGVTVTALCPGPVATDFAETAKVTATNLFKRFGIAEAEDIARYGYRAMMRGTRVAIPSWRDKIMVQAERFAPRRLVTRITRSVQESR